MNFTFNFLISKWRHELHDVENLHTLLELNSCALFLSHPRRHTWSTVTVLLSSNFDNGFLKLRTNCQYAQYSLIFVDSVYRPRYM